MKKTDVLVCYIEVGERSKSLCTTLPLCLFDIRHWRSPPPHLPLPFVGRFTSADEREREREREYVGTAQKATTIIAAEDNDDSQSGQSGHHLGLVWGSGSRSGSGRGSDMGSGSGSGVRVCLTFCICQRSSQCGGGKRGSRARYGVTLVAAAASASSI